jgi:hypothetical protein
MRTLTATGANAIPINRKSWQWKPKSVYSVFYRITWPQKSVFERLQYPAADEQAKNRKFESDQQGADPHQ